MSKKKIKFGTDGWRDKITENFTFENIERVTEGVCRYLIEDEIDEGKGVVVGFDTRYYSKEFAMTVAKVFTSYEIPVYLSETFIPTPALSHIIKVKDLAGGVMITASHNPPEYNGFKFFPYYGGPAYDHITQEIEKLTPQIPSKSKTKKDYLLITPFEKFYKDQLRNKNSSCNGQLKIVVDSMYGAGCGFLSKLLQERGHEVFIISEEPSADFNGKLPEPTDKNLKELKKAVVEKNADLGLALDGDGDRFGVISPEGEYISPNRIFAPVADDLVSIKKEGKRIFSLRDSGEEESGEDEDELSLSRTISTTHAIDKIARKNGLTAIEKPVGFKYLAHAMLEENAIMGAEESGGLSIDPIHPEKDGIASGLYITKLLEKNNTSLKELLLETEKKYGTFVSKRLDLSTSPEDKERVLLLLDELYIPTLAGKQVSKIKRQKGLKLYFEDDSWCLIRPSGTEDLIRIYGESTGKEDLEKILTAARKILKI